jgi:hypothetical protein
MGVVKATETGSKLKWSARANAMFQVMQVSEVLNVSWSSALQWVLPSIGATTSVELANILCKYVSPWTHSEAVHGMVFFAPL